MKVFFPVPKGTEIGDKGIAFLNCGYWNNILSVTVDQYQDCDIIEYEANYWDILRKMYQRHSGDARMRWQLAYKDMSFYYRWVFKNG